MKLFKQKNQYCSPHIKCIPLESDQAILQICRVGGAFFWWGTASVPYYCSGDSSAAGPTASNVCFASIKGQSVASVAGTPQENENVPS